MKLHSVHPEYVDFIPRELADGTLYISRKYGTASHKCACGCGTKIVTPIKETEYDLSEDGGAVSLCPSIGNWNHPCQSHYWIKNNRVIWAGKMTPAQIQRGRACDDAQKRAYFRQTNVPWWGSVAQKIWRWLKRPFS